MPKHHHWPDERQGQHSTPSGNPVFSHPFVTCNKASMEEIDVSALEFWRPRRDLNPCYRRERKSKTRNLLKPEDTDGSQSASKDVKGTLIGRQSDARFLASWTRALALPCFARRGRGTSLRPETAPQPESCRSLLRPVASTQWRRYRAHWGISGIRVRNMRFRTLPPARTLSSKE